MPDTSFEEGARRVFRDQVRALSPATLLDVGCGEGGLLREASMWGASVWGVEPDAETVATARAAGLDVVAGEAERLPVGDAAFDVVVFEYSAHHVRDLSAAMREAARAAKRAVCVLDAWYDTSRPAQALALEIDAWFKSVDRAMGKVHNLCPTASDLVARFLVSGWKLAYAHHVTLALVDLDHLDSEMRAHAVGAPDRKKFDAVRDNLVSRARRVGVEEAGAILFTASR